MIVNINDAKKKKKKILAEKCSLPANFSKHSDHLWLSPK